MYKYFKDVTTLEELRKQYKNLLKKFHPDCGGSEEDCKAINLEYEKLFQWLKIHGESVKNNTGNGEKKTGKSDFDTVKDAALRAVLARIIHLDGIEIEICGSWIWVTGNTYPVKEQLKESCFNWSKAKKSWYWAGTDDFQRTRKHGTSMEYIRNKYGSETVKTEKVFRLV